MTAPAAPAADRAETLRNVGRTLAMVAAIARWRLAAYAAVQGLCLLAVLWTYRAAARVTSDRTIYVPPPALVSVLVEEGGR